MDDEGRRAVTAPLDVPMTTIAKVGTGLWAAGLVVTTAVWAGGHLGVLVPATCGFGVLAGLGTIRWARKQVRSGADG